MKPRLVILTGEIIRTANASKSQARDLLLAGDTSPVTQVAYEKSIQRVIRAFAVSHRVLQRHFERTGYRPTSELVKAIRRL